MGTSHSGIYKTPAIPGINGRQEKEKVHAAVFPTAPISHQTHSTWLTLAPAAVGSPAGLPEPDPVRPHRQALKGLMKLLIWCLHRLHPAFAGRRALSLLPRTQRADCIFLPSIKCANMLLSSVSVPKISASGEERGSGWCPIPVPDVPGNCLIAESKSPGPPSPCLRCLLSDFTFYELFLIVKHSLLKSKALPVHCDLGIKRISIQYIDKVFSPVPLIFSDQKLPKYFIRAENTADTLKYWYHRVFFLPEY